MYKGKKTRVFIVKFGNEDFIKCMWGVTNV